MSDKERSVGTKSRTQLLDITGEIDAYLKEIKARSGLLTVFVPHTTAGVTVTARPWPARAG